MNKLTKLTIKKFRNVAPTTLEFSPGLNVPLGKNAAGKTTLLRLLSTVMGVQEEALRDEVLEVSYRVSGASLDFEHTITRTRIHVPDLPLGPSRIGVEDLSTSQQTDLFVFEKNGTVVLSAEVFPNQVVIKRGGQSRSVARSVRASPILSVIIAFAEAAGVEDEELAVDILWAHVGSAGRMDESLGRLETLLGARREEFFSGWRWNLGEVPQSMRNMPVEPLPQGTSAVFSLAFLDRVSQVLGYDSANARFDVERFSPEPDQHVVRLSNLRFFFKRPGEEISHDLLSYGQKRLLSFFAHADASTDVVMADELVNGLHHEWIAACLEEIGQRQAFLTSQNPLLLDFLRFESAEEVRRTFILCERENRENGAQLIWRNPTEEEAESFFSAYQTGIQRVSDILLTKGLW